MEYTLTEQPGLSRTSPNQSTSTNNSILRTPEAILSPTEIHQTNERLAQSNFEGEKLQRKGNGRWEKEEHEKFLEGMMECKCSNKAFWKTLEVS